MTVVPGWCGAGDGGWPARDWTVTVVIAGWSGPGVDSCTRPVHPARSTRPAPVIAVHPAPAVTVTLWLPVSGH